MPKRSKLRPAENSAETMLLIFEDEGAMPALSLVKYLTYFRAVYRAVENYEDKPASGVHESRAIVVAAPNERQVSH